MGEHVQAMLDLQKRGRGDVRLRQQHPRRRRRRRGVEDAFGFPGFVPAYIRPLFCEGKGPFRWAVLSRATPRTWRVTDDAVLRTFPEDRAPSPRWITLARERCRRQGLPARICWLGYGERAKMGLVFNDLVRTGRGERAHRDRPRPPRRRLGGLAQPRDGSHDATARTRWPTGRS